MDKDFYFSLSLSLLRNLSSILSLIIIVYIEIVQLKQLACQKLRGWLGGGGGADVYGSTVDKEYVLIQIIIDGRVFR